MNKDIQQRDLIEFQFLNEQQIHENIKFADQKAVQIIAINGVLLGFLFQQFKIEEMQGNWIAFVLCALFIGGIGAALLVIKPRGIIGRKRGAGVIDSSRIAQSDLTDYLQRLSTIKTAEFIEELRIFVYDRATIDQQKYKFLRISIYISFLAWVCSIAFFGWVKLFV
ncbi:hypothetical protein LHL18_16265 [Rheinheimera aquimaris]|nr:hypothetical protein [Rheinheimera aquimaris]MCB5215029.1 hypothetical protein [Rheinheimera aquimaris]